MYHLIVLQNYYTSMDHGWCLYVLQFATLIGMNIYWSTFIGCDGISGVFPGRKGEAKIDNMKDCHV